MKIMFVIWMLLRRILSHWRLELCLFLGLLVATAVTIAVPLYTNGALQNSFVKAMRSLPGGAPFTYTVSISNSPFSHSPLTKRKLLTDFQFLQKKPIAKRLKIPLLVSGWSGTLSDKLEVPDPQDPSMRKLSAIVLTMTELDSLVTLAEGHFPAPVVGPDGTVEMVCSVNTADKLGLVIGNIYQVKSTLLGEKTNDSGQTIPSIDLRLRLVGTFNFRIDRLTAPSWVISPNLSNVLFVHPRVFLDYLIAQQGVSITGLDMTWVFDYRKVWLRDVPRLIVELYQIERECKLCDDAIEVTNSQLDLFTRFRDEQKSLRLMMLTLAIPTFVLVLYYIFLTAGLIVNQRRGEIAMLKSRGAGTIQLTGLFMSEWTILGIGCLIAGPLLGLGIAQILGSSAGFLNFVDRKALPVGMTGEAYIYSISLALVMIIAATVPAAMACHHSIVQHKQERSRIIKPLWQRFYLDILLIGAGGYGYRTMLIQNQAANQSSARLEQLVDPLLFIIPVLAIIGGGLLVLRFFPMVAGWLEKLAARRKGVVLYASLLEVSRNILNYQSLILLLILTTASGIYTSAMARTLNQNTCDRIYYATGTDIILHERWFPIIMDKNGVFKEDKEHPCEPPFSINRQLPGVLAVARVQVTENVPIITSNNQKATVMAIDPWDFGNTAWFRPGLTPLHQNVYLNLLTKYPQGILVSKNFITRGIAKVGDTISVRLNGSIIYLVIAGAVDYWPTLYEDKTPFIVGNLNYITAQSALMPYDVWLRLKPGCKMATFLQVLQKKIPTVTWVKDARRQIVLSRRDPERMGLYGIMSIGFCIAVMVTVTGYFLYAFFGLQKRLLQFGVLRAIGLSLGQLIGILGLEQLWSAGVGLIFGTLIGQTVSGIFVPFLQTATAMNDEIPPFRVIISGGDIFTIYSFLLPVLILALGGLAFSLARLQIHQAVKLGEE